MKQKNSLDLARVMFLGGPNGRNELMVLLAEILKEKYQIKPSFVSFSPGDATLFEEAGAKNFGPIIDLPFFTFGNRPIDVNYLQMVEKKYGFRIWSSWQITAPRKKKRLKLRDEEILPWLEDLIKKFEEYMDEHKPEYLIYQGIAASIQVELFYRIAQKKGCRILQITNGRVRDRIIIDDSLTDTWPLLVKRYNEFKNNGLTPEQKKKAEEFISDFRLHKPKPSSPVTVVVKETVGQKITRLMKYPRMLYLRKRLPSLGPILWWPITDKILEKSSLFENPVQGEKFVFFPLHYQPEASTSLWGKWHVDQPCLIEKISKALPAGYKLYVKEHTHGASGRPKGFYQKIKGLPNVRLIRPTAKTFDLIQKSSLIATITGTVGWEGIIFQKPVLCFGDIFYNVFEEVKRVSNIEELPELIDTYLEKTLDYDKVVVFVAAILHSHFLGSAVCPGECRGSTLRKENLECILTAIEQHVNELYGG
ncbi:hypothetical protein CL619_02100 [archaeon]|nr:hypothetical protein [archaeon]|tara:strand:+ start:3743 stop:5176 length:1434 start_codon:yes stop_codon:yes gene_type:complete